MELNDYKLIGGRNIFGILQSKHGVWRSWDADREGMMQAKRVANSPCIAIQRKTLYL